MVVGTKKDTEEETLQKIRDSIENGNFDKAERLSVSPDVNIPKRMIKWFKSEALPKAREHEKRGEYKEAGEKYSKIWRFISNAKTSSREIPKYSKKAATNFEKAQEFEKAAGESPGTSLKRQDKNNAKAAEGYEREGNYLEAARNWDFAENDRKAAECREKAGNYDSAAESYEELQDFKKAAENWEKAGVPKKAGEDYEEAGELHPAAENYKRINDKKGLSRIQKKQDEYEQPSKGSPAGYEKKAGGKKSSGGKKAA